MGQGDWDGVKQDGLTGRGELGGDRRDGSRGQGDWDGDRRKGSRGPGEGSLWEPLLHLCTGTGARWPSGMSKIWEQQRKDRIFRCVIKATAAGGERASPRADPPTSQKQTPLPAPGSVPRRYAATVAPVCSGAAGASSAGDEDLVTASNSPA